jgi:uncharacterized protein YvpB
MRRTVILSLLTLVALVAGAITVLATPTYKEAAARATPGPLLVVETTPTPTPAPTPAATTAATPVATAAATPNGTVTIAMPVFKQTHGLDCETAALQMALAAMGRTYTQDQLIAMQPAPDTRGPLMGQSINGHKTVKQWGDPYKQFVGNIDGADWIPSGYGIYYPPLLALVQSHGFPNSTGGEGTNNGWTAERVYSALAAGHPVMVWVETGWMNAYVGTWTAWDGAAIRYSLIEHVVTLSGVSATQVRVNDPWKSGSQYWFSKAAFQASWADFNNMAIILQ